MWKGLGFGTVVVVALLVWALGSRDDGGSRIAPDRPNRETSDEVAPPRVDSEAPSPEFDDPNTVSGVVVDASDRPVFGAQVSCDPSDGGPPVVATSDDSGRFALRVQRRPWLSLVARHPKFGPSSTRVHVHDVEPVRIVLERGAKATILVSGPDGVVAGAKLTVTAFARSPQDPEAYQRIELQTWTTDERGAASLGLVPLGWIQVRTEHEGFPHHTNWFEVQSNEPETFRVKLRAGGAIDGVVLAPDGKPVAGAEIFDLRFGEAMARTDGAGRYRVDAIGSNGIIPAARAKGYGPTYYGERSGWSTPLPLRVEAGALVSDVNLELSPASSVSGRVIDPDGAPLADVSVRIEMRNGVAFPDEATTRKDGRFLFASIAAGKGADVTLEFFREGYWIYSDVEQRALRPGQNLDVGTIQAERKATIRGTVLDVDGSPLLEGYVSTGSKQVPVRDGRFQIDDVFTVEQEVVAYGFGPQRPKSPVVRVSPEDGQTVEVELRLARTLGIAGKVVTANGTPREDVHVAAVPVGTKRPFTPSDSARTDAHGKFELPMLFPGRYKVGFYRRVDRGYEFLDDPAPQTVSAGRTDLVFRNEIEGGYLTGRVVNKRTGKPMRAFEIALYERVLFVPRYRGYTEFEDGRGAFRVPTQTAAAFWVDAWAKGQAEQRGGPFAVKQGETVDVGTIALGEPGSIAGLVHDHRGRPVPWCRIYLLGKNLKAYARARYTNAKGEYLVDGVTPGTYILFAVSPRHPLAVRRQVTVAEEERTRMNIDLARAAPLTLTILDAQGKPIRGAQLIWTCPDIAPLNSSMIKGREPPSYGANESDERGRIHKPYLPAGEVEILVSAKGRSSHRRTLSLRPGEKTSIEIRLR